MALITNDCHDRWIGDYCAVETIPWPTELREAVLKNKRRALRNVLLLVLIPAACLGALLVVMSAGNNVMPASTRSTIGIILGISVALSLVVAIISGSRIDKARTNAAAALKSSVLERFELAEHVGEDLSASTANELQLSVDVPPLTVLVEPESSLILQIDDTPLDKPQLIEVRTVARPTSYTISNFPEQRFLETAEIQELHRLLINSAEATKKQMTTYLWMGAVLFSASTRLLNSGIGGVKWLLLFAIVVVIPAASLWAYAKHRKRQQELKLIREDIAAGIVEGVAGSAALADPRSESELHRGVDANPDVVGRLPQSGLWWEVDGVPAPWRRNKAA